MKKSIFFKLFSIVLCACFFLNTVFVGISSGAGHDITMINDLAPASILNHLMGMQHKDIGRVEMALRANLRTAAPKGRLNVKRLEENITEDKMFDPVDIQMFFREKETLSDTDYCVRCRIREEKTGEEALRDYYAVFSLKGEGNDFGIKIYTKEEWPLVKDKYDFTGEFADRAKLSPGDEAAKNRYIQHEEGLDSVIKYAHENGLAKAPVKGKFNYSDEIKKIYGKLNLNITTPEGLIPIEERDFFFILVNDEIRERMKDIKVIDYMGVEIEAGYEAHSSNRSVHVFVDDKEAFEALTGDEGGAWAKGDRLKERLINRILPYEIGVMLGYPLMRPIVDGVAMERIHNVVSLRAASHADGAREWGGDEWEKKQEVVDLDKEIFFRDYALMKREAPYFIGMSMGGTKLYVAAYENVDGEIRAIGESVTVKWEDFFDIKEVDDMKDPEKVPQNELFEIIVEAVREVIEKNGLDPGAINNIGATVPGPADSEGRIISPERPLMNMTFHNFPFADKIEEIFKGIGRGTVKHDARAGLEGEVAFGGLTDVDTGYYVIQGSGLGGALAVGRKYFSDIPEVSEPGHHLVGKPLAIDGPDRYRYKYRFIEKFGLNHPYEVVKKPDSKKPYQITRLKAEEMLSTGEYSRDDFIWVVDGENDYEDIVSKQGIVPMLADKERLVLLFGGTAEDYKDINTPEDLTPLAFDGDAVQKEKAKAIMRHIAEESGKGLAALASFINNHPAVGSELERIVIGSGIGENLGLHPETREPLTEESGEDFYFHYLRQAAASELVSRFGADADKANALAKEIIRTPITQEERETAAYDRSSEDTGDFLSPSAAGLRNSIGTFDPFYQLRSDEDFGIYDFRSMEKSVDVHSALGQNVIQFSPLTLSSAYNSPYSVASSRAMDPVYASIESLFYDFGLPEEMIADFMRTHADEIARLRSSDKVDYAGVTTLKMEAFKLVWGRFKDDSDSVLYRSFKAYMNDNSDWLEDHMLYMILKDDYMEKEREKGVHWTKSRDWDWRRWAPGLRDRDSGEMEKAKLERGEEILFRSFMQFALDKQYNALVDYGEKNGVHFMVDIPFALDGADIWLNPEVFGLKKENGYKRIATQGVPPEPAYPSGQYWQFYPYDWTNPETMGFILDLFKFNQKRTPYIRLDHVLGYYRTYLFTEDVDSKMTLGALGLYEDIYALQREAMDKGEAEKREAARKAYGMVKDKLMSMRQRLPEELEGTLYPDSLRLTLNDDGSLAEHSMIKIARRTPEARHGELLKKDSAWLRTDVVESKVYNNIPKLDFIRVSPGEKESEEDAMYRYLFPDEVYDADPFVRGSDSLRLSYFDLGRRIAPGEEIMSEFLRLSQEEGTTVIWETLGVVPPRIQKSVERLGGTNYLAMVYGQDPSWGEIPDPYYFENHLLNAFVTHGLHDSPTMKTRWESEEETNKDVRRTLLNNYFGEGNWTEEDVDKLTFRDRVLFLTLAYISKARISALTWMDLLGLGEEYRINDPVKREAGEQQWINRLPKDASIEKILDVLNGDIKNASPRVMEAVELIWVLSKIGNRIMGPSDDIDRFKEILGKRSRTDEIKDIAGLIMENLGKREEMPDNDVKFIGRKILNITPAAGEKVAQIRRMGTNPFHVDATILGAVPEVIMYVEDENGEVVDTIKMKEKRISASSTAHGLPENIYKWTAKWQPEKPGIYKFRIKARGIFEESKYGYLIAVDEKANLNPESEDFSLKDLDLEEMIEYDSIRSYGDSTDRREELLYVAADAGLMIPTHPDKRYTLILPGDFFARGDLPEYRKRYGDRFNLEKIVTTKRDVYVQRVLEKSSGIEDRSVAIVPDDITDEQIEKLTSKGIRVVRANLDNMRSVKYWDKAGKESYQVQTFGLMYAARRLDKDIEKTSPLYKILSYYLESTFAFDGEVTVEDYIDAMRENIIEVLQKGFLKPIEAFDIRQDYESITEALIYA